MGENRMEGVVLHEDEVRRIYEKLEDVREDVASVKTSLAAIKVGIEHSGENVARLDKFLKDLDRILYGKGDAPMEGLVTRIAGLEKAEMKRQTITNWLWAGIAALGLEAVARFLGIKQ